MRKARENDLLSQAELARKCSIGRTSVVAYETGRSRPSRPGLLSWSLVTGVSYEWLCHGDTLPCGPPQIIAGQTGSDSTNADRFISMQRLPTQVPA